MLDPPFNRVIRMNRDEIKQRIFPIWFSAEIPPCHVAVTMPVLMRVVDDMEVRNYPHGMILMPPDSGKMSAIFPRNAPNPEFLALILEKSGYTETELLSFERELIADEYHINYPGMQNIKFVI